MAAIVLPYRMRQQPQNTPVLDFGNPLLVGVRDVVIPTSTQSLVRNQALFRSSATTVGAGRSGVGWKMPGGTTGMAVQIGGSDAAARLFTSSTECTIFLLRRSLDTTNRASTLFGYIANTSNDVVAVEAPTNTGSFNFSFGNISTSAGGGRLGVAFTKTTTPETLVCVAGAAKGREIWRNGVKIAGNTAQNASLTVGVSGGSQFTSVGGWTTTQSDNEEVFLAGVVARAWSDAEIREWSNNPWGIFKQYERLWILPPITSVDSTVATSQAQSSSASAGIAAATTASTSTANSVAASATVSASLSATVSQAQSASATAAVLSDAPATTSQAQAAAATAGILSDAPATSATAQSASASAAVSVDTTASTGQAQSVTGGQVTSDSASTSGQVQSAAADASVSAYTTTSAAQVQGASASVGIAIDTTATSGQVQTAAAAGSAVLAATGSASQVQGATAAAAVVSNLPATTGQAQSAAAEVGIAADSTASASQAQSVSANIRAEQNNAAETDQAQSVSAQASVGIDTQAASSQAQSSAAQLNFAFDVTVQSGQVQTSWQAAAVAIDAVAATAQASQSTTGALYERSPNEVAVIDAAIQFAPAVAGGVEVFTPVVWSRSHMVNAVKGSAEIEQAVDIAARAKPATAGKAQARPA